LSTTVSMSINGLPVQHEIEERTLLVTFIRDVCRLTGTHIGCDTAQCGACTVHLNGRAIKSCSILAVQAQGAQITTIEGIAKDGNLHPMQEAFKVHHGLQCGYCTPGMIMSAIDLINKIPHPTKDEIREQLDGNLCRCTGYHNIVHAVHEAARLMNP
jgi:aerobic carbon-monoxide dehydrogenase small subunit